MKVDTSDQSYAARVVFAAAWFFNETSRMNAANHKRDRHGEAPAYGDESYAYAADDARAIATGHCDGNHSDPCCADDECWLRRAGA